MRKAGADVDDLFQSTLSMRRATRHRHGTSRDHEFQSTLSMRRATGASGKLQEALLFQSTLSMRRATFTIRWGSDSIDISIHALHEESDLVSSPSMT